MCLYKTPHDTVMGEMKTKLWAVLIGACLCYVLVILHCQCLQWSLTHDIYYQFKLVHF